MFLSFIYHVCCVVGQSNGEAYRSVAKQKIQDIIDPSKHLGTDREAYRKNGPSTGVIDTWIYPMVQMGPFGISQDDTITQQLFHKAPERSHIKLASGYFNLTSHYMASMLNDSAASFNILTASPEV
jgi:CDP-diacylglycerol--glycerol-3-phosphate 3-phosphatidyltransferase